MLEEEEEKVEEKAADQSEAPVASRAVEAVAGSHWNDEYGPLGYGSFNCVCCNAWLLLLLLPTLFLLLVAPGLELEHGGTLTRAALALFGLSALFFCLVSNTNPGVAPRTAPYIVGGERCRFSFRATRPPLCPAAAAASSTSGTQARLPTAAAPSDRRARAGLRAPRRGVLVLPGAQSRPCRPPLATRGVLAPALSPPGLQPVRARVRPLLRLCRERHRRDTSPSHDPVTVTS